MKLHTDTVAGNVAKSIVEYAATGAFDLLVIGQTGQSGVWGTFLGTTADKVVRHAPCSVLVVRRSDAQPATAPKPATVPAAPPEGTVTCRTCGEENPATALLCARCRDVLPRPL